jgi:hypothetical protein
MIPKAVWGGTQGWPSAARRQQWDSVLMQHGILTAPTDAGLLIRFYIDATEWVPHPYAPPARLTADFHVFSQYVAPSEEAFQLCSQWHTENANALTHRLTERLRRFSVRLGARYDCDEQTDYADVALLLPGSSTELLQAKTVWKGEALAEL